MSSICNHSTRFVYYKPISDVSSDLSIEIGASCFALHKVERLRTTKQSMPFFGVYSSLVDQNNFFVREHLHN
ncbi:hypothetical protein MtrunA17_Chr4g0071491 [Medicago truncatula]|uniref:Uncharacterized protein n=1 Tax=Medicago truncatula TaxID=3880 RepID=G7JT88_MEDTR|nr:hypothetical protein MTR_4g126990 [Medicago truncatula]RHN64661.1 hypothetical protein MtrunA17_Chr4g0071491 [Medicago truncatula]